MSNSRDSRQIDNVRNHWWWRPGWREGRHFYACHFTFGSATPLRELVTTYQSRLADFVYLDLIPHQWLHLTFCGIGFVDEVTAQELDRIHGAIQAVLSKVEPLTLTFEKATIRAEAIVLMARPIEPLKRLHATVSDAIQSGMTGATPYKLLEQANGYKPHVSLAYVNATGPAAPISEALRKVDAPRASVTVDSLPLLQFHRDRRMYEWTTLNTIPFGQ